MTKKILAYVVPASAALVMAFVGTPAPQADAQTAPAPPTPEQVQFFESRIRPVLEANCYSCHGGKDNASGGLNLSTRATLLKGGDSGAAAILGKPSAQSLLMHAVRWEGREMPPSGKLSQEKIDDLAKWVDMGMPWPAPKAGAKPDAKFNGPPPVNAKNKKFWSFVPVKSVVAPVIKQNAAWVKTPVDAFVLAGLQKNKLKPNAPATKADLLRRVTYDLTGLPPTTAETKAFLADTSPNAYAKVVDRLLASPRYGEKWARHWLDVVRYAETNSFERDDAKPFAWRYRDWVVDSFNSDKPYNQFVREQLAGDEIPGAGPNALIGTGYLRLGQWDDEPSDPLQARFDELDDITSTTAQAFLGMTVGCARCHDHKIDPIPQKDYYAMAACFSGITRYGGGGRNVAQNSLRSIAPPVEQARYAKESAAFEAQIADLDKQTKAIETIAFTTFTPVEKEDFRGEQNRIPLIQKRKETGTLTDEQIADYARLLTERRKLARNPPKGLAQALCVTEKEKPDQMFVALRGNPHAEGDNVEPGFLSILSAPAAQITPTKETSGRRTALANWITDPRNPMTARVWVNRVWQHHFGRGIVRSSNNFGLAATHQHIRHFWTFWQIS